MLFPRKRKRGIIYSRLGAIDFFSLLPTHRPFKATLSDTDRKKALTRQQQTNPAYHLVSAPTIDAIQGD
jgi:hypothetical protein